MICIRYSDHRIDIVRNQKTSSSHPWLQTEFAVRSLRRVRVDFFRIGADDQYGYRYRYDGLYVVEEVRPCVPTDNTLFTCIAQAWTEPGLNEGGFLVCKFVFQVS